MLGRKAEHFEAAPWENVVEGLRGPAASCNELFRRVVDAVDEWTGTKRLFRGEVRLKFVIRVLRGSWRIRAISWNDEANRRDRGVGIRL